MDHGPAVQIAVGPIPSFPEHVDHVVDADPFFTVRDAPPPHDGVFIGWKLLVPGLKVGWEFVLPGLFHPSEEHLIMGLPGYVVAGVADTTGIQQYDRHQMGTMRFRPHHQKCPFGGFDAKQPDLYDPIGSHQRFAVKALPQAA